MLLEAEQLAAPLMDGLPRNAHDEAMDAWPADPAALLPPLPRDLVRFNRSAAFQRRSTHDCGGRSVIQQREDTSGGLLTWQPICSLQQLHHITECCQAAATVGVQR